MKVLAREKMSSDNARITSRQIGAARELLELTQAELAASIGMFPTYLAQIENRKVRPRGGTLDKIRAELERCGIEFINGGSPGVRYHPSRDQRRIERRESSKSLD